MRLSMAVSRVVMGMWDKQLSKLGEASGWVIHLLKRYVDDVSAILETLKMGVRWVMPNVSKVPDVSNKCVNVSDVIVYEFGKCEPPPKQQRVLLPPLLPPTHPHLFQQQVAWCTEEPGR